MKHYHLGVNNIGSMLFDKKRELINYIDFCGYTDHQTMETIKQAKSDGKAEYKTVMIKSMPVIQIKYCNKLHNYDQ